MRHFIFILLSLQHIGNLAAQTLPVGRYSMLEKMTVGRDFDGPVVYTPGIYPSAIDLNSSRKQWYHKTTLFITDTAFTVTKVPVYISSERTIYSNSSGDKMLRYAPPLFSEKITYSDSSGGFYYYDVKLYKINDTTINVRGWLKECKYCPNYGDATPKYVRLSFAIYFHKENLTVDTNFEKGLLFKKEE